jgi:16S rRNA (guanine527-N7)-methyltransferase
VKHAEGPDRRESLRHQVVRMGLRLDDGALDRLVIYEDLLRSKAVPLGFIAESDAARLLERHVLDSLRAAVIPAPGDRNAMDLGSGAGLPGIVLALACPHLVVTLVESQRRRIAFLELAVERLELSNTRIAALRVEEIPEGAEADLCFARAFGSMERSWVAAEPLLATEGRLVYFAGAGAGAGGGAGLQASAGVGLDVPEGARILEVVEPALESGGPLVIMGR